MGNKKKMFSGKRGMENIRGLTATQEKILSFLRGYVENKGFPPTLREIASHFGLKGPRGPQKTLQILERKGYIRKTPGGSRAIEILKPKIGSHRGLPHAIKNGRPAS